MLSLLGFAALVLVLILALRRTQFEIRKDSIINASPEKVWNAVIDFENYKQWNSQLQFLSGEVKSNGKLYLKLSTKSADPYEVKPIVSHWEERKRFPVACRNRFAAYL